MSSTNKFTVAVGDWSDDGHGKHTDFIVEVPEKFTEEVLGANFAKNVKALGFGPDKFAEEYEDSTIDEDYLKSLREFGFTSVLSGEDKTDANATVYLGAKDMLNIVMFYFGHKLDDFEWKNVNLDAPALIGYWSKVTNVSGVGYGLFY